MPSFLHLDSLSQKKAYRKLAQQLHPDKNKENEDDVRNKFQDVVKAYTILIDAEKRKIYDRTGTEAFY